MGVVLETTVLPHMYFHVVPLGELVQQFGTNQSLTSVPYLMMYSIVCVSIINVNGIGYPCP